MAASLAEGRRAEIALHVVAIARIWFGIGELAILGHDAANAPGKAQGDRLTATKVRGVPVQTTKAEGIHGAFADVMHGCVAMDDQLHGDRDVRAGIGAQLWDEAGGEQEVAHLVDGDEGASSRRVSALSDEADT